MMTVSVTGCEQVEQKLNVDTFFKTALVNGRSFEEVFKEKCRELERELIDTSPVDTGRYRAAWTIEFKHDFECEIWNRVRNKYGQNYGIFLMYGTEKFKNSQSMYKWKEVDPLRGILHDVRKVTFRWQNNISKNVRTTWRIGVNWGVMK